jgi:hypothetical protein
MENTPISEEAFMAGFSHGYTNGRAGTLSPSDMETNAKAAYQIWLQERQKEQPPGSGK